jgi:hypothetical protein
MATYLLSGDSGLPDKYVVAMLTAQGYSPYPDGEYVKDGRLLYKDGACGVKYVDFLYVENFPDMPFDPNTYGINCDWHSLHEASCVYPICRKDRLHDSLKDSGLVARTWPLDEFEYNGGVYILRPSHMLATSGIDILIVDSPESWEQARNFYTTKISAHSKYHKKHMQYYRVIVSEYIARPLLFEGRKFHLRLYGINLSTRGGFWIARGHGKILTAAKPFALANFADKGIHDTHLSSTPRDLIYPEDFPRPELIPDIDKQLDKMEAALAGLTTPQPYGQATRSFSVYGLDVMIDEDGRAILIEVNDRAGMGGVSPNSPRLADMFARHCSWIASFLF